MGKEHKFQTEVQHLLDLMIHSLYSNKDIFLRELVANAADAIDKAHFASLTNDKVGREWQIRLALDKEAKTLTISDNGIGMNEAEVIENIGTIAKSGTKAFMQDLAKESKDKAELPELIGQFGVGFYSAFMVADKVELVTKKAGTDDAAVKWSSSGIESYRVEKAEKEDQGTEITLFLKEDATIYLEEWKVSEIVRRYSDFIAYPIMLPTPTVNEAKEEVVEDRVLNSQKAIWLRKSSEVSDDEYQSFFTHLNHGGTYAKVIPMSAEGTNEFKALLFIPQEASYNIFMPDLQKKGLQLYVRRVFITDQCSELLPDYLRFMRGVVDSSELPLNVSREILQENPRIGLIQKAVTTKVLAELKKLLAKDRSKYLHVFHEFGKILKEGIHTDFTNQEKIKSLAMYESLNTGEGEMITLEEYVKAMPESQKDIYYITADSRRSAINSPALEIFRKKGYDVLFMTDPIDEWVMQSMYQFDKKYFKPATKGELLFDEDKEKIAKELEKATTKHKELLDTVKKVLDADIEEVRFTSRLTDSACVLVTTEKGLSAHMERLFKALNENVPHTKRILELNPKHPLVAAMENVFTADKESELIKEYALLLYDQALLTEGSPLPDPLKFTQRVTKLMTDNLKKG